MTDLDTLGYDLAESFAVNQTARAETTMEMTDWAMVAAMALYASALGGGTPSEVVRRWRTAAMEQREWPFEVVLEVEVVLEESDDGSLG